MGDPSPLLLRKHSPKNNFVKEKIVIGEGANCLPGLLFMCPILIDFL